MNTLFSILVNIEEPYSEDIGSNYGYVVMILYQTEHIPDIVLKNQSSESAKEWFCDLLLKRKNLTPHGKHLLTCSVTIPMEYWGIRNSKDLNISNMIVVEIHGGEELALIFA